MYLNYSITKLFALLIDYVYNYKIFIAIILSCIIYCTLYFVNINNKKFNLLTLLINFILIVLIIYYYNSGLMQTGIFNHFSHNMYFYFLNSIIYLVIVSVMFYKNKLKRMCIISYGLGLIFLLFALFMTYYLSNIDIVVLGNIYPSIVFGNYIYFIYYFILIVFIIKNKILK